MKRSGRFTWSALSGLLVVMLLSGCSQGGGSGGTAVTPPDTPSDKTIALTAGVGPAPRKETLSRTREESVVWQNNDDRGHTIRFTDWPFREPQQDIPVEAGQKSKKFHTYKGQDHGTYSYGVFPPVPGDPGLPGAAVQQGEGPPDPPAFEVGD